MPATCCAYNCTKRFQKNSGITFHRFPYTRPEILEKWIKAVRRANWKPTKNTMLCSLHFDPKCFRYCNERRYLLDAAVPSIFDFPKNTPKQQGPMTRASKLKQKEESLKPISKARKKCLAPPSSSSTSPNEKSNAPVPPKTTCLKQSSTAAKSNADSQSSAAAQPNTSTCTDAQVSEDADTTHTERSAQSNGLVQCSAGAHANNAASELVRASWTQSAPFQERQFDHTYICPSPRTLTKQIIYLKDKLVTSHRSLNSVKKMLVRTQNKIKRQETLIKSLRSKLYEKRKQTQNVSYSDVLNEIFQGEHSNEYSESLKKFALTLQFHSAKAYRFLGKYCRLPHPRTLYEWETAVQ